MARAPTLTPHVKLEEDERTVILSEVQSLPHSSETNEDMITNNSVYDNRTAQETLPQNIATSSDNVGMDESKEVIHDIIESLDVSDVETAKEMDTTPPPTPSLIFRESQTNHALTSDMFDTIRGYLPTMLINHL